MIQLESLTIEEFRGIRSLSLRFDRTTFAICGPNGTGKSGVVDAIEFALTGDISRLSGEGTDGLTVKSHAPHVDKRNAPQKARVLIHGFIPTLNKSFTLERSVGNAKSPKITPSDPDLAQALAEVALHPEFALTRREIIKYILATPNNRAKAVQALLRLEELEKVRSSLNTIQNAASREATSCDSSLADARRLLLQALQVSELKKAAVLEAVNALRLNISLPPLDDLEATTSLKEGLDSGTTQKPRIVKKQAATDLATLKSLLNDNEPTDVRTGFDDLRRTFQTLKDSPGLLASLRREAFLRTGLSVLNGDACPFCDAVWEQDLLRERVQAKLAEAKQASALKDDLRIAAQPVEEHFREVETRITSIVGQALSLDTSLSTAALKRFAEDLKSRRASLQSLEDIDASIRNTHTIAGDRSRDVDAELSNLSKAVAALPDSSKEDAARDQLTLCQDRLETYRRAKRASDHATKASSIAAEAMAAYSKSVTHVLEDIYIAVESDFSTFYKVIHHDDEDDFVGKLLPSLGKLDFDVDFYGRGFFPPGAYHSEGHQDSMGVCLYLALMRHTLQDRFTFAVLDDVLMSVDAGHRREVCTLLKQHFSGTQFVITTHDDVWLQHMRTEKIVTKRSFVHFKRWSVDDGPVVWEGNEVWTQIDDDLKKSGVSAAAATLRRYLEYDAQQLAQKLQATVPFRGDARWDLGELLPPVINRFQTLLGKGADAAQSWRDEDAKLVIANLKNKVSQAYNRTQAEQWPINTTIHYNAWNNLQEQEFLPVANAFKELLLQLRCQSCDTYLHVLPQRGSSPEELRCDCGKVSFNLKKRDTTG